MELRARTRCIGASRPCRSGLTKTTHPRERNLFKACTLAVQYGQGAESFAARIGKPVPTAQRLLRLHRETYRVFWRWSDRVVEYAMLERRLQTTFGWTMKVGPDAREPLLRNFIMQANGAEMLRLACCFATEQGVRVCAPVHDAVLIEASVDSMDEDIARMREAMAKASRVVLDGFELDTDIEVVRYPERYVSEKGAEMWECVSTLLRDLDDKR